ncbi:MAG: hypothetical protein ACOCUU_02055 [Nanoarchaeota archaeon]
METNIQKVEHEVNDLKKIVFTLQEDIKEMKDCVLTSAEESDLDESLKQLEKGEVFSSEDIEQARNARH